MSGPKAPPVIAIDVLRFCCAMLVVAYHYGDAFWFQPGPHVAAALSGFPAQGFGVPIAKAGAVGVELFFIISGMVIARSANGVRWSTFLYRRALRLVPAAWICATITLFALVASGQGDAAVFASWFRSIRFWPIGEQIDGSYWTLGVELAFYLFVAASIGAHASARRIECVGVVLGLASAAFWIVCLIVGPGAHAVMINQTALLLLLPHGCLFALGIAIEAVLGQGANRARLAWLALLIALAMNETAGHIGGWQPDPATLAAEMVLVAGIALLLASGRLQPVMARWITPEAARTIGIMTYPLYLIHQDAGAIFLGGLMRIGVNIVPAIILTAGVALVAAWLIATRLEPRVRRLLVGLSGARPFRSGRAPATDIPLNAFPPAG